MLVLTRKQNEKVQIGDSITITVLKLKGKTVRLGIEAPNSVNVLRGELVFDLGEEEDEQATAVESGENANGKNRSNGSNQQRSFAGDCWPTGKSLPAGKCQELGV